MKSFIKKNVAIIFYIILFILLVFTISEKKNYHVDETLSFSLANHVGYRGITYEEGQWYDPSEIFLNLFAVNDGERFNYRNVWKNQADDVHPPLYYAVLHTVFSVFPGRYTRWFPGIVNIFFSLATLYAIRKLVSLLTDHNEMITNIISILFCLSAGTLSMAAFFRMYVMAMFFVTLFSYVLFKNIKESFRVLGIVQLLFTALGGALTHYYVVVFMVFLCLFCGIYLIIINKWAVLIKAFITMVAAAGCAIVVFPSMLKHMFTNSNTGTKSVANFLGGLGAWWERMKAFFSFINMFWFGGILLVWILFIVLWNVTANYHAQSKKKVFTAISEMCQEDVFLMILSIATVFYFAIISKVALAITDRYVSPIYSIILVCITIGLWKCVNAVLQPKIGTMVMIFVVSVMIVAGWKTNGWRYLYNDEKELLDVARRETSGKDCVYICNSDKGSWKINANWTDLSNVSAISFISVDRMNEMDELSINDKYDLVLYIMDDDAEKIADAVKERYGYSSCRYLYSRDYSDAFLLSRYGEEERDFFAKNE